MIKINLASSGKQSEGSSFGGLDFTQIKIKLLLLVIAIIYIPDFLVLPAWEESLAEKNNEVTQASMTLGKLKRKVTQNEGFEKQIQELKAQEENFGKKLLAVKGAISEKKNPASLLLYISKNIPKDLWIRELVLENNEMIIRGDCLEYTSIGNFISSLKSSVFIRDYNIIKTGPGIRPLDKRRIETFEVKFNIARFDS